jgi:hypothetical protein
MKVNLSITKYSSKFLVIEPWGEEFDIGSKEVKIIFSAVGQGVNCDIEIDCSEDGFLRVENPSGFRPIVLINGIEDERPAFALS